MNAEGYSYKVQKFISWFLLYMTVKSSLFWFFLPELHY